MFKISYNRAIMRVRVETVTPLSIRAGETGLDPTSSDLACVRTHHRVHGTTVYIPGSSFKGVLRSTAEAQLRGQRFKHQGGSELEGACDPANHRTSCAQHKGDDTAAIHRANCLACRIFGSLSMRGRCAPRDLFPFSASVEISADERANLARANRVEVRHGVLIDRISGAVAGSCLFDQEIVPAGITLHGEIALHNYQAWQLGLLWSSLDELNEGFAQLGSSKTRGLGVVRVEVDALMHEQRYTSEHPAAVGDLVGDREARDYGLFPEVRLPAAEGRARGLSRRFEVSGPDLARWRDAAMTGLANLPRESA